MPTMRTESGSDEEIKLDGWAVKITSYQIGRAFLTELACSPSGTTIARGIAPTKEDSRAEAFAAAARRLLSARQIELRFELMVGG